MIDRRRGWCGGRRRGCCGGRRIGHGGNVARSRCAPLRFASLEGTPHLRTPRESPVSSMHSSQLLLAGGVRDALGWPFSCGFCPQPVSRRHHGRTRSAASASSHALGKVDRYARFFAGEIVFRPPTRMVIRTIAGGCDVSVVLQKFPNGGSWSLFICPECGRRARLIRLVGERFVCRRWTCAGLRYCCEQHDKGPRIERLRARLAGGPARLHPRPGRVLDRRDRLEVSLQQAIVRERRERVKGWPPPGIETRNRRGDG